MLKKAQEKCLPHVYTLLPGYSYELTQQTHSFLVNREEHIVFFKILASCAQDEKTHMLGKYGTLLA